MIFAKGSSPFLRAVSAFVFLLFLYGRYRSSTVVESMQAFTFAFNSEVKTPCSSKAFRIAIFRFSKASNNPLYLTISPT